MDGPSAGCSSTVWSRGWSKVCSSITSDQRGQVWFWSSALPFTVLFQLALSPSPRNPAEPIAVQNNQQLALKVEGVVQHGSKPGLFRRIQSVCLNVSSTLQSKSGQDYKVSLRGS